MVFVGFSGIEVGNKYFKDINVLKRVLEIRNI